MATTTWDYIETSMILLGTGGIRDSIGERELAMIRTPEVNELFSTMNPGIGALSRSNNFICNDINDLLEILLTSLHDCDVWEVILSHTSLGTLRFLKKVIHCSEEKIRS